MTRIALLGAGGKMGVRLATNLKGSRFEVDHVEVAEEGRRRLKAATGADCVDQDRALAGADVVLMAVPDRLIGKIALNLARADGTLKASLKGKRKYAGCDDGFMATLIAG